MPSDTLLKVVNTLHKAVLKATGGRVGGNLRNMPVVELTTKGRKSGQPRAVMLTVPIFEDGAPVVVASRGGDDTHPAWFLNLRADPDVDVLLDGERQPRYAHVATAEERARIWPELLKVQPHYGGYQDKTDREIPLVILQPRPSGTGPA